MLLVSLGLMMALTSAAAGILVYGLVQAAMVRQSMAEVGAAVHRAASHLVAEQRTQATRSLSEDLTDLATGTTYVMVATTAGRFELSKGPPPPVMPTHGWIDAPARGWLIDRGTAYAYARQRFSLRGRRLALLVVRREGALSRVMSALGSTLLLAGGLLMAALLACALIVVQAITEPLRTLRRFADRVARDPGLLDERLRPESGLNEVDGLTQAFNRMLERLAAGRDRERQFSSHAAHALRTPVQVIGGYLHTLARWGHRDPGVRRQALSALRREVIGMESLIQRLLTLSQVDADRPLATRPVDMATLLEKIRPDLMDTCPHHPLTVEADAGCAAIADADLLTAVLRVLVENADVYADVGSPVRIRARRDEGLIEIAVANEGTPIPEALRPHLFERFYRGRQPAASGHVGLGLAIADVMVQQMRGEWRLTCENGVVVFAVRLPAALA